MASNNIQLTANTRSILAAMPSEAQKNVGDYLNNPFLQKAALAGKPLRLFAGANRATAWMEVCMNEHAEVDIQLWQLPPTDGQDPISCPATNLTFFLQAPQAAQATTENFTIECHVIALMMGALTSVNRTKNVALTESIVAELGTYIPWVKQATTLVRRIHGANAGTHVLTVFEHAGLGVHVVDAEVMSSVVWPCVTAQALLSVHASALPAPSATPEIYALEYQGAPTTYLFIPPPRATPPDGKPPAHAWLSPSGVPMFFNDLRQSADAVFPNMQCLPDAPLSAVQWAPQASPNTTPLDQWSMLDAQNFNPETRALCDQLANSTCRALSPEEKTALVSSWTTANTPVQALWENTESKRQRTMPYTTTNTNKAPSLLAMWGKHAANIWAAHNPNEHAVLDTLLPKMDSLDAIEMWRVQMREMTQSALGKKAQIESFSVEAFVDQPS